MLSHAPTVLQVIRQAHCRRPKRGDQPRNDLPAMTQPDRGALLAPARHRPIRRDHRHASTVSLVAVTSLSVNLPRIRPPLVAVGISPTPRDDRLCRPSTAPPHGACMLVDGCLPQTLSRNRSPYPSHRRAKPTTCTDSQTVGRGALSGCPRRSVRRCGSYRRTLGSLTS